MKLLTFSALKWLIPAGFAAAGALLYGAVHGHGFLGLICFAIAGVIACYFAIALLKRRYFTAAKVLNLVLTGCLCAGLAVFAITEGFILHASRGNPQTPCDYIIVLGAKVNGTAPSLSLSDRIHTAYDYLSAHPDTVAVLSGGQGEDEAISEAECMRRELTKLGIADSRLWLESQSTSTWENLSFSLALIAEKTGARPDTVGVLSSEYHLFRAGLFAGDCGAEAVGIPAATSWPTIRLNYFLREVGGVWHYLVLGGQYHD